MFENPILGDPITAKKEGHYSLDWINFVPSDQLLAYTNNVQNQHANKEKGWSEFLERIADEKRGVDLDIRWWEYRGKTCKKGKKAPLVVCLYEYFNTSWQHVADKEGLVVIAFEYHRNQRNPKGGLGALGFGPKNDEIEAYDIIIERAIEKYNCDRTRVYMNGLSYGDFSSVLYASRYGYKLAGLASVNGPVGAYNMSVWNLMKDTKVEMPVLQIRSDDDFTCDGFPAGYAFKLEGNEEWIRNIRSHQVQGNRDLWVKVNKCDITKPEVYTNKRRAFIRYKGKNCDVIFAAFNRNCHIAPVDNAQVMWDHLYSKYRRNESGKIEKLADYTMKDKNAVALVAASKYAYIDNKKKELSAKCVVLDPKFPLPMEAFVYLQTESSYSTFYAPADVLTKAFGLKYNYKKAEKTLVKPGLGTVPKAIKLEDGIITFIKDKTKYELQTNSTVAKVNGKVVSLDRPVLWINGSLMIPVCEVADLLGLYSSFRNDAVYICDHYFELDYTFTRFLREEILTDKVYKPVYRVICNSSKNGKYEISNSRCKAGETLKIKVVPNKGFKASKVLASMNGVSVLVNKITDSEYWVCNVFGDVELAVEFRKA